MLCEQIVVDARLIVEAFQEAFGNQINQIAVAFRIFAEQNEVIRAALGDVAVLSARLNAGLPVGCRCRAARAPRNAGIAVGFLAAIMAAGARDVNFAADDRLHAARGSFVMKVLGGKKIAVIRDSHGGHALVGCLVYQFRDVASAVEKTVVGVEVKMDKTRYRHWCFILVAARGIFHNAARAFARVFNRRAVVEVSLGRNQRE
jgi:hypothetical protein